MRDGSTVTLRPVGAGDEAALLRFLHELCASSRRLRFFTGAADLRSAAHWAADVEPGGFGLIASDPEGRLLGHAAYARLGDGRAEVAVEVADRMQGLGLGTILIERLAKEAERRGVSAFVAEVLPENRQMLAVFRDGFDAEVVLESGTEAVAFPTAAWRLAEQRFGGERAVRR